MKGKQRLGEPGYYITWYGINEQPSDGFGVVHISKELKCKYLHWSGSDDWYTLMWSCAPTKKQIRESITNIESEMNRFIYFESHEDLVKYKHLTYQPTAFRKSPLEI